MIKNGTWVQINMAAADSTMKLLASSKIKTIKNTRDVGTGIVLEGKQMSDEMRVGRVTWITYRVAVVNGRFDPHRNDLGDLWVNDFELDVVRSQSDA